MKRQVLYEMIKKIAVLYMRMSTDMQEHSIESQERVLMEYAKRNGYIVIRKYIDRGISGQHASKRPDFMKMIDDSETGEFQYVLIYDSSRFARNLVESLTYKSILKENCVRLISMTEPNLEDDEMSLYIDAMQGAANEIYVRKLSKSTKRGHNERALRGDLPGNAHFGVKLLPDKSIVLDEVKAPIIRWMYEAIYHDDATYYSISETLAAKGIKSQRGNIIDSRQVKRMLMNIKNKAYHWAERDGKPVLIKGNYPAVIEEELFDAVQEIIAERAKHYKKHEKPAEFRKHWLSGLLVCPYCGGGYSYNTRKPPQHDAFRCGNQTRGACKKGSQILVDAAVEMVLDKMSEVYTGPLAPYVKNITVSQPEPQIDYDKEIRLLEAQLKRAKQAYLAEIDTIEEYAQNKRRISSNIKELQEAKCQAQEGATLNEPQFKVKLLNVITLLKSDCPMSEKIPAARSIIEKILVDPRNKTMDIYFFA